MRIHLLSSHFDQSPVPRDLEWAELVELLTTRPLGISPAEAADPKSDSYGVGLGAWIPADLKDSKRGNRNVADVCALVLDFDDQTIAEWTAALQNLAGHAYVWHSTRKHRPVDGKLRYRVAVQLSRPVEGRRWKEFYTTCVEAFAASINRTDGSTCDPTRLFYLPARIEGGADFESGQAQGQPLDVDTVFEEIAAQKRAGKPTDREQLERLLTSKPKSDFDALGQRTLKALLHGPEPEYAPQGQRDEALFACAHYVARRLQNVDPQSIVDALAAGLDFPGCRHAGGKTLLAKVERAMNDIAEQLNGTDPVTMCQLNRSGPYTEVEISRYIAEQNIADKRALSRQMLLIHRSNVYVFTKGDYQYAGTRDSSDFLAMQELALGINIGVHLQTSGDQGIKDKPWKNVLKEFGSAVRNVKPALHVHTSYVDWPTQTLWHAICPRRPDLVPAHDPAIESWLETWGDDTLLDWLATAPKLEKATAALFLHGAPNSGKTMLAQGLATIWGNPPTAMEGLGENFNDEITQCPIVFADETIPERFRKDSGLLRRLITATHVTLNRKYMESAKLHGAVRVIIAKNNMTLFGPGESMTREDVDAVAERLLYYRLNEASPYFHPVRLAQHILWLEETRVVDAENTSRLWVKGRDSALHRHMRISSRDRSLVCQFVLEMLMNPSPIRDANATSMNLRGGVAVSPLLIYRRWDTYLGKERQLDIRQIAQVLGEIGVKNSRGLYALNMDDLRQWAAAHSYPEDVDNLAGLAHDSIQRGAN